MLLLGIDLGTSSVKVSVTDASSGHCLASARYPSETEAPIISLQPGWAEQSPDTWWEQVQQAIKIANASGKYNPSDIAAIGIAYQMHGLVLTDKDNRVLRNAIIWCDSRAVPFGEAAFAAIGQATCLKKLLNSPGNFTASKLAWVKANEPEIYGRIKNAMLPGDFIALRLTGNAGTTASALSEGILWDFESNGLSDDVMGYFGFDKSFFPEIRPVFAEHGQLGAAVAASLSLKAGIPVSYKAGDQPNNALSLNVLEPGEVAATAGTSGVIYGVSDALTFDPASRVNTFAHVNHSAMSTRTGVLLCVNGTGILNRWIKDSFLPALSYPEMNEAAAGIKPGSDGLTVLPFGNGAERILNNRIIGGQVQGLDFNLHQRAHVVRAAQEGIAFSLRYGLDIMRENGMHPKVIRAGKANMFLSQVFTESFVNATNTPVELYDCDGSIGAAIGAGIGAGIFKSAKEAFAHVQPLTMVSPTAPAVYESAYQRWKEMLLRQLR